MIFIQNSIIHDNLSSQVGDKRRYGFGQWMNLSNVHDNICSLIHKQCHPKSYQSNINYHMTLNIISSVDISTCLECLLTRLASHPSISDRYLLPTSYMHTRLTNLIWLFCFFFLVNLCYSKLWRSNFCASTNVCEEDMINSIQFWS